MKLIYPETRKQIEDLLKDYIGNQEVGVKILTQLSSTLKELNHKINVKIFNYQGSLERIFDINLWNTENIVSKPLDKTKQEELNNLSLNALLGVDLNKKYKKNELKIIYFKYSSLLHEDKLKDFFEKWWNKIKKPNDSLQGIFDFVYNSLEKSVFVTLKQEFNKIEVFFKQLDSYDKKILDDNEDVNQFYRYLELIMKLVNSKYSAL